MEQHYHQLLRAARSPLRGNISSCPHPTHSSICVGQSFVTLPSFGCQRTPTMPLSLSPTPAVSGWRREVRYTLCPHIPSCRGASPTGRIPPSPQILLIPHSQAGSIGRVGRDGLQRGDARWGDPTRPKGGKWHPSPPVRRQSLLEVSELSGQHVPQPRLPGVHLSPWRWGETVKLRPSVSQIQADALLQQFEANLALGFPG